MVGALRAHDAAPSVTPTVDDKSVAVLPFANMSAVADDEYFADDITDEIINLLSQLQGLRVAARTSCFAFKGKNEDLRVVADKLGVKTVLEGSVRSRARIDARPAPGRSTDGARRSRGQLRLERGCE